MFGLKTSVILLYVRFITMLVIVALCGVIATEITIPFAETWFDVKYGFTGATDTEAMYWFFITNAIVSISIMAFTQIFVWSALKLYKFFK